MTTLAQQIIEAAMRPEWYPTFERGISDHNNYKDEHEKIDHIKMGKNLFKAVQEYLLPVTNPEDAYDTATKFIFTIDAAKLIYDAIINNQINKHIPLNMARLPSKKTWIEWREKLFDDKTIQWGALIIEKDQKNIPGLNNSDDKNMRICILSRPIEKDAIPIVNGLYGMHTLPFPRDIITKDDIFVENIWSWEVSERAEPIMQSFLSDVISILFLITLPRACEIRDVVHDKKLQNSRIKNGKLPLVEYKTINVKVGVGTPRYKRNGDGPLSTQRA
jgi:hypothetical protein